MSDGASGVVNKPLHYTLWTLQGVLALLFLSAGITKFFTPAEVLTSSLNWPVAFFYFIGVCEVLGAMGLVLPSALRIKPGLTPLAALGLVVILIGAVTLTIPEGMAMVLLPLTTLILTAFVGYGRWKMAPIAVRR
jgi:uncharacterized membrane protein